MDRQEPILSYRGDREPEPERGAPVEKTVNRVFQLITWTILGILLVVWAVVGAVFWIPLMLRAMFRFSLSLLQSVFVGQSPEGAARILKSAVSFYRRGFVVAVEVVTKEDLEGEGRDPDTGNRLLLETLWAVPVWYLILLWTGWIQASPGDLWNWFSSIQWGAMLDNFTTWFRGG